MPYCQRTKTRVGIKALTVQFVPLHSSSTMSAPQKPQRQESSSPSGSDSGSSSDSDSSGIQVSATTPPSRDEKATPVTAEGVGLSNPQLSHGRRKMLDLVNKLQSTGYASQRPPPSELTRLCFHASVGFDIDLPQIAVTGQQSAGKSSLIESISGITLPRASGTCTRYVFLMLS
jgi:hypothetical protein